MCAQGVAGRIEEGIKTKEERRPASLRILENSQTWESQILDQLWKLHRSTAFQALRASDVVAVPAKGCRSQGPS